MGASMLDHPDVAKLLYYLVFGLFGVLATIAWSLIQRWVLHVDSLQGSIDRLREIIELWKDELREEFVLRREYEKDLHGIRRDIERVCRYENCPINHDTDHTPV
jgi:hypothetical protein